MLASFAKIEVGHPEAQWPAHFGVKSPKDSIDNVDVLQGYADREQDPKRKEYMLQLTQVINVLMTRCTALLTQFYFA